ncbi:DUF1367 family protein [Duganella sp. FT94W]|uniref:DUF1367 family protein n=1 Tax=Duganella lactea TaxID=2692173 RepID=A0ABW9V6E0_9BURK|nr:DUF1367 family protein [Duganella lactea]MYM34878.1 DUF1367 family protein [Duganella lactea]
MSDVLLTKTHAGTLAPADEESAEHIAKLKLGETVSVQMRKKRNMRFHRKYFALLDFAFEQWEPSGELTYQGMPVAKNKERFRKDLIILAGFYESTVNIRSEVRLEAKSISFAQMDEVEFEQLYNATVDVVLRRILTRYTRQDLDEVVNQLLRFT